MATVNTFKLPDWLHMDEDGRYVVSADILYPLLFDIIGVDKPTQYDVKIAGLCAKSLVRDIAPGWVRRIYIANKNWAIDAFPSRMNCLVPGADVNPLIRDAQKQINIAHAKHDFPQVYRRVRHLAQMIPVRK